MSSTNQLMNNNTSTSNSRSGKKSSKKTPASVTVEQSATVILTSASDVEITVSATDNSNLVENATVVQTIDIDTTPSEPATPVPVVNIWKLREQARDAEEALKSANDAIAKISKGTEKSKPKAKSAVVSTSESSEVDTAPSAVPVASSEPDNEGWTAVKSAKSAPSKPKSDKPFVKYDKTKSDKTKSFDKSDATKSDTTKSFDKSDATKSDKPKTYVKYDKPREPTAEQVASRQRKNTALLVAQEQLIVACLAQIPSKTLERIDTDLNYIKEYRRTQVLKFDDDSVVVEVEGETFEFSRTHFFDNRIFQNKMREKFGTLLPTAWLRFFPGRDENTYCIGISKRRDFDV